MVADSKAYQNRIQVGIKALIFTVWVKIYLFILTFFTAAGSGSAFTSLYEDPDPKHC
jgi:hypothetical protein